MPEVQPPIMSAANPLLKAVRKAVRRGRTTDDGLTIVESPKLVAEALESPCEVEHVLVAERAAALFEAPGAQMRLVADKLFDDIARAYNKAVHGFYAAGCRYLQLDDIFLRTFAMKPSARRRPAERPEAPFAPFELFLIEPASPCTPTSFDACSS